MKPFTILTILLLPEISVAFSQNSKDRKHINSFPSPTNVSEQDPKQQQIWPNFQKKIGYPCFIAASIIGILSADPVWASGTIVDDPAFQLLRREPPMISKAATPMDRANEQIRQLTDLQDAQLAKCEDRGEYWEQCFYYGMRNDNKGIDFQWGSPEAALEPPKSPQSLLPSTPTGNDGKMKPPTW